MKSPTISVSRQLCIFSFNDTELNDEVQWRTGKETEGIWDKLTNETFLKTIRAFLLLTVGLLILAGLGAAKMAIFAMGNSYHRIKIGNMDDEEKDNEFCKVHVATFWTLFAPVALQLLWNLLSYLFTQAPNASANDGKNTKTKKYQWAKRIGTMLLVRD